MGHRVIPASGTSLRAVIFDLWDTLVPFPLDTWNQMTEELAARLGVSLSRLREEAPPKPHVRH